MRPSFLLLFRLPLPLSFFISMETSLPHLSELVDPPLTAAKPAGKRERKEKNKVEEKKDAGGEKADRSNPAVRFDRILSDEEMRGLAQIDMFALTIVPTRASQILKTLTDVLPLNDLDHLKRIRKDKQNGGNLSLLLCPTEAHSEDSLKQLLLEKAGFKEDEVGKFFTVPVSRYPPLTKSQFDHWTTLWPLTFHDYHRGQGLKPADLREMEHYMASVLEKGTSPEGLQREFAIMVDPQAKKIVAEEFAQTGPNPLKHAVVKCIDTVGETLVREEKAREESLELQQGSGAKRKLESVELAAIQHLCNGFDLYTNVEPCVMCAMALVHSRIRRVVYTTPEPKFGGLGGRYKIHTQKGVNHHFNVYLYSKNPKE